MTDLSGRKVKRLSMTDLSGHKVKRLSMCGEKPAGCGWRRYLSSIELRGTVDGVLWFGVANCNYFLFSDGSILCNYGYHGQGMFNRIKEEGAKVVLASQKRFYLRLAKLLKSN